MKICEWCRESYGLGGPEKHEVHECRAILKAKYNAALLQNGELCKALEHIADLDGRVEPITWIGAFSKAVEIAKAALTEKSNEEVENCPECNGSRYKGEPCRRCSLKSRSDPEPYNSAGESK